MLDRGREPRPLKGAEPQVSKLGAVMICPKTGVEIGWSPARSPSVVFAL